MEVICFISWSTTTDVFCVLHYHQRKEKDEMLETKTETLFKNVIPVSHGMSFATTTIRKPCTQQRIARAAKSLALVETLHIYISTALQPCRLHEYYNNNNNKNAHLIREKEKKFKMFWPQVHEQTSTYENGTSSGWS